MPLCFTTYRAMKMYRTVEVQLHALSASDGDISYTSRPLYHRDTAGIK